MVRPRQEGPPDDAIRTKRAEAKWRGGEVCAVMHDAIRTKRAEAKHDTRPEHGQCVKMQSARTR